MKCQRNMIVNSEKLDIYTRELSSWKYFRLAYLSSANWVSNRIDSCSFDYVTNVPLTLFCIPWVQVLNCAKPRHNNKFYATKFYFKFVTYLLIIIADKRISSSISNRRIALAIIGINLHTVTRVLERDDGNKRQNNMAVNMREFKRDNCVSR